MTGRYVGTGIGLALALAEESHASFAISTSFKASAGVSPNAEQAFKSGMSAM